MEHFEVELSVLNSISDNHVLAKLIPIVLLIGRLNITRMEINKCTQI